MSRRLLTAWTLTVVLSAAAFACTLPAPASASITLGTANTTALLKGLVGYWTLDGSATTWTSATAGATRDLSGNGNTGTLTNMKRATSPVAGKIGGALGFISTSAQYIQLASTSATSMNANLTISAWVYATDSGCCHGIISKGSQYYFTTQYRLQSHYAGLSADGFQFSVSDGTNVVNYNTPTGATLRKWTHVVCSTDTTKMWCYVNGTLTGTPGSRASIGPTFTGDTWFSIGTNNPNQQYFRGNIDDVRVYNRVLSPTEVALLYAVGQAGIGHSPVPATSKSAPLSKGLVGYWIFDGPATNWRTNKTADSSGNNNTGTLVGMSTSTSPIAGKIGGALKFNGSTSYVKVSSGATLGSGSVSECAWVNISAFGTGIYGSSAGATIFSTRQVDADKSPTLVVSNVSSGVQNLNYVFDSAGVGVGARGSTVIATGKWYHLCGVFSYSGSGTFGGTWDVYVNGAKDNASSNNLTVAGTASFPFTSTTWTIGYAPMWTNVMNGKIDDFRIYNRALSAAEVKQLYAAGATNIAHSNTVALSNGLVGRWSFDGPTVHWDTGKVDDASGNNNTGTLVGMSTTTSPVAGKIGQGMKFNGSNFVSIADSNSLDATTVTVAAWIKTSQSSFPDGYGYIIKKNQYGGSGPYSLYTYSAGLQFVIYTQDAGNPGVAVAFTRDGKWHHVVGTYDGTVLKVYIDGVFKGSTNYTGLIKVDTGAVTLGGWQSYRYFDGTIDDARIYNRALSPQEVQQLYLIGR